MKCKPLLIGLDISGNEVLYPSTSRKNDPSIINHYIDKGYNIFRLLVRWEKLQPSLSQYLIKGTIPPINIPLDSSYSNLILSYVDACVSKNVPCIIQFDNGFWYDVSYDKTFVNDGTKDCPTSNYVYVGQTESSNINGVSYIGPTVSQFTNMFITLSNLITPSGTQLTNRLVRFGFGQNPTLDMGSIVGIVNKTISNLRASNINNILHFDFYKSDYDNLGYLVEIEDTINNSIININYFDDSSNGNGPTVKTENNYLITADLIYKTISNMNTSIKVSFGDVRFDSSTIGTNALSNFLSYLTNNISVFESVCLFAIGDSSRIPSYYDLNYTTDSGTIVDKSQLDVKDNLPSYNSISKSISLIPITDATYIQDNPYGTSNYSLTSPSYLPFNIINSGMEFTIEFWFKNIQQGIIFGASNLITVHFDGTNLITQIGSEKYINVITSYSANTNWNHFELSIGNSGINCFINGSVVGKSNITMKLLDMNYKNYIGLLNDSNNINSSSKGQLSNFVIWNYIKHTDKFDVPTSSYTNQDNILVNFTLDNNLNSLIE